MSSTAVLISEIEENLFKISLGGGISLQPTEEFIEIPLDGMFIVDEFGDYVPVEDPSLIDDLYFENDGGDIIPKNLLT